MMGREQGCGAPEGRFLGSYPAQADARGGPRSARAPSGTLESARAGAAVGRGWRWIWRYGRPFKPSSLDLRA